MDSLDKSSNEDNLKRSQISEEGSEEKQSFSSEDKASLNLINTSVRNASLPSKEGPSEISDTDSLPEKDILTPLGNPNLKDLKYISKEIPIYANLFRIELERNYILHEYAVNFAYEGDDKYLLPTVLKQKIINSVSSKIFQNFKNFIFIGGALFSEMKVEGGTQISTKYNSTQYIIDVLPTTKII